MRKWLYFSVFLVCVLAGLFLFSVATVEADTGWTGTVTVPSVNVRPSPDTSSAPVDTLRYGETVTVQATVQGETVGSLGSSTWYQIGSGQYVYAPYVAQAAAGAQGAQAPDGSADFGPGERWIDVDLTNHVARAMVGNNSVYLAEVTVGRPSSPTPVGTFHILRRVADETMDSSTIGIPRNSANGYYYTGVLYTQYFLPTGQALHYNYWVPDSAFGSWSSSRGCVGLRLAEAKFFWDFATIGTRVVTHY